ncbi:MAG TPA: hypothetical protein G4O08_04650 [Anaerolineae bacterium]|nr:hypothetical protein [Anaerolineae bacterium]
MSLIDRYVHEVGRHLPRTNRADIQAELRSLLIDALEDRAGPDPTEAEIITLLKEHGSPRAVAASYHPEGQYLIGPALYPLFRLVMGIVLAAVLGAQILAWTVAAIIAQDPIAPLHALDGLLTAIPSAIGSVVVVFAILQRFEVRPDVEEKVWDPKKLPKVDEVERVKRGERIFGIVMSTLILVVLVFFPQWIGFVTFPGGEFFANPIITQYIVWISIAIVASIGLDIYLLWQGRWTLPTRLAKIAMNLLSITILILLIQGHTAWLADHGGGGWIATFKILPENIDGGFQVIGMHAFRLAFGVAVIVTSIETLVMGYRMLRDAFGGGAFPITIPLQKR